MENFSIVGMEDQNLMRTIKEAIYIWVNNPSLNKNIVKYHLPHIWDKVLLNTSELKMKSNNPCYVAIPSARLAIIPATSSTYVAITPATVAFHLPHTLQ